MSRSLPITSIFCLFWGCAQAFNVSGFDTPESVQADPETGAYYITNVHGEPTVKDGNGYISKVPARGNAVIRKFIGGKLGRAELDAPTGLVVSAGRLFVADIDKVKVFDRRGRRERTIDLSPWKAEFLNDLAIDGMGVLYASDMTSDRIFRIDTRKGDEVVELIKDERLGGPNGLMINPRNRNLMVVTWEDGRILEIDDEGRIHVLKRGLKTLDGIDHDCEGNLYVSSFDKGEVYRIPMYGRGTLTVFLSGLDSPADIACDRTKNELLVPSFKRGQLHTYPLPAPEITPLSDASLRPKIARR